MRPSRTVLRWSSAAGVVFAFVAPLRAEPPRPFIAGPAPADSAVALYNRGNAAYREGRYSDAVEAYRRALTLGARNGDVYHNLGDAYFRLGRTGPAILAYERALRLDPRDEDARQNLRFVSLLIPDRIQEENLEIRVRETVRQTLGLVDPVWLAAGLSAGLAGLCFVAAWWLLGGRRGGLTVTALVLCGLTALGSGGIAGAQRWVSSDENAAIVLAGQVEVRFEPSAGAKVAFVVHEGTKVWVERREEGWGLVSVANGLRGWLPADVYSFIASRGSEP